MRYPLRTGPRVAALALAALLALLAWVGGPQPRAALAQGAPDAIVAPEVRASIARDGRARVIVELRLPAPLAPEGELGDVGTAVQQGDIAAAASQVLARLAGRLFQLVHRYDTVPLVALEVGGDALAELEAAPFWVRRVQADQLHGPTLAQSVPLIGADLAWARGYDGTGTVVAILDTGVDATHPFLANRVVEEACFSSNVSGRSVSLCPNGQTSQVGAGAARPCTLNGCFHGTHVAGIAAGNGPAAGVSFSGVARGAQIMAVQVFSRFTQSGDCGGSPPCVLSWTSDQIAGLERVYARRSALNLVAANMSLGGSTSTAPCDGASQKPIIDNLRSANIATVIAAGNNGSVNALSSPGCISSAISVGATTKADVIASYSNAAYFLSLFAPGSSINSSTPGGGYTVASGTSMATPHVVGTWAILRQAVPTASVSQILSTLQTTGLPIFDSRPGGTTTKSRIRVNDALSALLPLAATTLSVSPVSVAAGGTVAATWAGIPSPTPGDWIGLFSPGALNSNFIARVYVGCGASPGTVPVPGGSCPIPVPGTTVPGTYELRLFGNNTTTRLATSGPLTVTTAPVMLSESPTTAAAGSSVTATWTGITPPTATDWIGLFPTGAADNAYVARIYVGCGPNPGASGVTAGSCPFPLAMALTPGTYQLRLFSANTFTRLASSGDFTVTAPVPTSLSASPATVPAPGTVTAAWSNITSPSPTDWIGLFAPGVPDSGYVAWIYVSCSQSSSAARASGSCAFPLASTLAAGTYELRLFSNNGLTRLASSNAFTVTRGTVPTLSASPASIGPGGTETVTWSGIAAPSGADWIGLFVPGSADSAPLAQIYVGCGASPGGVGVAAGSCPFALPGTLTPRTYEFRLFANGTSTRLAVSNAFTVLAANPPTLSASPTSVAAGGTVTATWSNIAAPAPGDWIGLFVPGTVNTGYLKRIYVGCGASPGSAGTAAGSCPFPLSATLTARTYELRLFANNTFTRLAISNGFAVTAVTAATLTAAPSTVAAGGSATATWSGIPAPTPTDWIGLYAAGAADTGYTARRYVSCSATPGSFGAAAGSCAFPLDVALTPGSYQFRLFSNDGLTRLATSNSFTVVAPGGTALSASPTTVAAGTSVTATWSGVASPTAGDWIGLYVPGTPNQSYLAWMYVSCAQIPGAARATGSCAFGVPAGLAPRSYELRLLGNNGYGTLATSNAFTVTQ